MTPELELKTGSKVCLVMAYDDGARDFGDISSGVNLRYCRGQRYDFRFYAKGFDKIRHPSWSKILFVREALRDYDWVMWMDADAIVTDHGKGLDYYMKLGGVLTIGEDLPKWGLNAGVFLLRKCDPAFKWLDEVWETPKFVRVNHEQERIVELAPKMGSNVVVYPPRALQGFAATHEYPEKFIWRSGDFIAHCLGPGVGESRTQRIRRIMWQAGLL